MDEQPRFILRDYTISNGSVLDIPIPAAFMGMRSSLGRLLLRAVSDVTAPADYVMRFEFLVVALDTETPEPIAYNMEHGWLLLGIQGSKTVYYRHVFE
jgi:hypothetical protein